MNYQIIPCKSQKNAEIVILSSGLGGHAAFWAPQIEMLTQYFQVLVYDQEGCHANSELLPRSYLMQDMAQQVLDILNVEQIKQCHFIGHALGALIGAELAVLLQSSDIQLSSLTFINAWNQLDPHTLKCFQARMALLNHSGAEAYVRAQALFLYPPAYISKNIEQIQCSEKVGLADFPPTQNVLARLNALMNFEITDVHVQALSQTALYYIANQDDFLVPYQKSIDLKNRLGHGEFALMPTGAHASTITETERVNQQILQNLIGAKT